MTIFTKYLCNAGILILAYKISKMIIKINNIRGFYLSTNFLRGYLGIKFIPDYAGPATQEITDKLVSLATDIYLNLWRI